MGDQATAAAIARVRDTVADEIRREKRKVRQHRDRVRELAQRLERLDAQLADFGIRLVVNTQPDQGGHSDRDSGKGPAGRSADPAAAD